MSAPLRLSDYRHKELAERVAELIATNDVDALDFAEDDVIHECARRYLVTQIATRSRNAGRARERLEMVTAQENQVLRSRAHALVSTYVSEHIREWSATILAGDFALPDGQRVTWGEATVKQHAAVASQLESFAAGDLMTAALHRGAIADIAAAGASSLAEVVS